MYQGIARVYDLLNGDVDYTRWTDFILARANELGVEPKSAVDAGCGTGGIAMELCRRGISVIGTDISEDMLRVASDNARRSGLNIPFIMQDMRDLRVHRSVDLICCACDGVNYLLEDKDARSFFRAAHRMLAPGGVLVFDISAPHKLENVLGNSFFAEERDQVAYIWQNRFDVKKRLLTMDITFFIREPSGLYRRENEVHVQRAHEPEKLAQLLESEGFERIAQRADAPINGSGERIHFSARRNA